MKKLLAAMLLVLGFINIAFADASNVNTNDGTEMWNVLKEQFYTGRPISIAEVSKVNQHFEFVFNGGIGGVKPFPFASFSVSTQHEGYVISGNAVYLNKTLIGGPPFSATVPFIFNVNLKVSLDQGSRNSAKIEQGFALGETYEFRVNDINGEEYVIVSFGMNDYAWTKL